MPSTARLVPNVLTRPDGLDGRGGIVNFGQLQALSLVGAAAAIPAGRRDRAWQQVRPVASRAAPAHRHGTIRLTPPPTFGQ